MPHKKPRCKPERDRPVMLSDLLATEKKIMSNLDDLKTELGRINAATTEIAADLKAAIDAIGTENPTPAQWAAFKADIAQAATALEAVAASYPPKP